MSKNLIYALHGFLGQSSDWNPIRQKMESKASVEFFSENLFSVNSKPILELEDYIDELAKTVEHLSVSKEKKIFIGYSLGGRLGLSLLKYYPDLFDHYIFISTNPGFSESEQNEKNKRLMADMKWASLINEKNWDQFIQDWNGQSVFINSSVSENLNSKLFEEQFHRDISNYDLTKLKRAMVMWSVSQQEDFREDIKEFKNKITWVIGEYDKKYCDLAIDLKKQEIILEYKKISCGHRVILEQPEEIYGLLFNFLS